MLSASNTLSFDMITKKTIYNRKNNENNEIDIFINKYLKKNIDQGDILKKWEFVREYIRKMKIDDIDIIINKYSNDEIVNELIEYYYEIFENIEFVFEDHINMIENVSNNTIKRNLVSLILFNSITYSAFLY
uniref:Uncharacterized protein n=1 Tax=viral metagenome TaxID=1070528 RepID=A0A6C0J2Y0_9ZZZZ